MAKSTPSRAKAPYEPWVQLKQLRKARGMTLEELGAAVETSAGHLADLENGRRRYNRDWIKRLSDQFGVPAADLMPESPAKSRGYPLIGKVGAGGLGLYEDDYAMGEASDYIDPLPGMSMHADVIVLEADGDSMAPLVFDGDLAFFGPVREDIDSLINKRVMARLEDGRKFFKILKRGSKPGFYTLRSLNPSTPDIEDVTVTWVLPYQGSRPRMF